MRVIHIIHGKANPNSNNGISRVCYFLNKYEKLAGVDSEIWAIVDGCKKPYEHKRDEFVTVQCFPRVRLFSGHDIIKRIEENKETIDIIHFHLIWFYDKNIIMRAVSKLGICTVCTTHGTYSKPHAYTGVRLVARWLYELKFLQMATECHILTPEEGTGLRRYGYTGKSFVAYNGFSREEMPQGLSTDFFKNYDFNDKFKISMVSVLRQDKNIDLIITAISFLPENIRKKIVFVLIGPDYKNNAAKYQDIAKRLNVEDCFRWVGPLYNKDKYDALNSSDAYIMASDSEGFSMAIIDAMACRLPMILTSGCNMKYISDKQFYLMCEPYAQELARAINKMFMMDDSQRKQLGDEARNVLEKHLYWDDIVKVVISNYKRILDENK